MLPRVCQNGHLPETWALANEITRTRSDLRFQLCLRTAEALISVQNTCGKTGRALGVNTSKIPHPYPKHSSNTEPKLLSTGGGESQKFFSPSATVGFSNMRPQSHTMCDPRSLQRVLHVRCCHAGVLDCCVAFYFSVLFVKSYDAISMWERKRRDSQHC